MQWLKRGEEVLSKYNSGWTRKKEVASQRKENKKARKKGQKRNRSTRRRKN
jgi:hypothetical protein